MTGTDEAGAVGAERSTRASVTHNTRPWLLFALTPDYCEKNGSASFQELELR